VLPTLSPEVKNGVIVAPLVLTLSTYTGSPAAKDATGVATISDNEAIADPKKMDFLLNITI
jgi:hypothetical protein